MIDVETPEESDFRQAMQLVRDAHDDLLKRLFGEVPEDVSQYTIQRGKYTEVMAAVQKDYGLVEGNSTLVLFIFEQLSRSPKFEEEDAL